MGAGEIHRRGDGNSDGARAYTNGRASTVPPRPSVAVVEKPLVLPCGALHPSSDLCVSFQCSCGATGHSDGRIDELLIVACGTCGRTYKLGQFVRLLPVSEAELRLWSRRAVIWRPTSGNPASLTPGDG